MKMKFFNAFIISYFFLALSFGTSFEYKADGEASIIQPESHQQNLVDSILKEWRADTLGCKGLRNLQKAQILDDSLNLNNLYPSKVIELLGKPDTIFKERKYYALTYYYGTICNLSPLRVPSDEDFCRVDFAFGDSISNKCVMLPICY